MQTTVKPDDESAGQLEAAKARYREFERRVGLGQPPTILMMADLAAARRMREKRKREAEGVDLLSHIPVKNMFGLIDYLIDRGFVGEDGSADPREVAAAVGRFLDDCVTRNSVIR